jgi:hypothetical protein
MKLNIEQIIELTGSAPPEQEGKEVVGIERRIPVEGDIYSYDSWWHVLGACGTRTQHRLVAIYEDTHREDGTPMYIDPLEVEGYRVENFGLGMTREDMGGASGYAFFNRIWFINEDDTMPSGNLTLHYVRLYKVAQPTTTEDLVGEDGQKNAYLHYKDGAYRSIVLAMADDHELSVCGCSVVDCVKYSRRWSHNPSTRYEDANEFVVEEK